LGRRQGGKLSAPPALGLCGSTSLELRQTLCAENIVRIGTALGDGRRLVLPRLPFLDHRQGSARRRSFQGPAEGLAARIHIADMLLLVLNRAGPSAAVVLDRS